MKTRPDAPYTDADLDALFARARAVRPDTSAAEYAFETRLLARLRTARPVESLLGALSWRMMPFFAVIAFGLSFWYGQVAADARETAQVAALGNIDMLGAGDNLN